MAIDALGSLIADVPFEDVKSWVAALSVFGICVVYPVFLFLRMFDFPGSSGVTVSDKAKTLDTVDSDKAKAMTTAGDVQQAEVRKSSGASLMALGGVGLAILTFVVGTIVLLTHLFIKYSWSEWHLHRALCWVMLVSGVATFLIFEVGNFAAPYGKFSQGGQKYGLLLNPKLCWVVMESFALVPVLMLPFIGQFECLAAHPSNAIVLLCFVVHYIQRSWVYPFLMPSGGGGMPVTVFGSACVFCLWNGYLQVRDLTHLRCQDELQDLLLRPDPQLSNPFFYLGLAMFACGMVVNMHSDRILRNLRKPGETGYKIPRGGLFEYVSGANFASEIFEWLGFAMASGSLAAVAFALFTFMNIGPRARKCHDWYLTKFKEEYPKNRKALVPFLL